jgi:hypothetical protein
MFRQLHTVEEVISELGGFEVVKELTGRRGNFTVPMWKHREKFPPNTFILMKAALEAKGASAPASLWGMPSPAESEAAE